MTCPGLTPFAMPCCEERARLASSKWQDDGCGWNWTYSDDVPALVAEVRRLRAIVDANRLVDRARQDRKNAARRESRKAANGG